MKINLFFIFMMLYLLSFGAARIGLSQSWQWGLRGGSSDAVGFADPNFYDNVTDMATDKQGNIYVLGHVFYTQYATTPDIDIDGHTFTGYGGSDIVIASFRCDGSYRWAKIIGGVDDDIPYSIKTDTLGGVYIAGDIVPTAHIYTDTVVGSTSKTSFILKYDSLGNYKWFRMPQSDTVSSSLDGIMDMDVDGAGNVYVLCYLVPSLYENAYVVTSTGLYVLKYNAAGIFLGGIQLQGSANPTGARENHFRRDSKLNRYYLVGGMDFIMGDAQTFGTTAISNSMYIGCFDNSGSSLWVRQDNTTLYADGFTNRPAVDDSGNIYLVGNAASNTTFNGHTTVNSLGPGAVPFLVKLDTNGNNKWAVNGSANSLTQGEAVAVYQSSTVAMLGDYPLKFTIGSHQLNSPPNTGYNLFLARFNAQTGACTGLDSIVGSPGYDNFVTSLTVDRKGNFYGGGNFEDDVFVAGDTLYNIGGETDWFIAKYGLNNCSCTATPSAHFSFSGMNTINFSYNGTTPFDSLKWTFGDGDTSNASAPSHTYSTGGKHEVCVTVYSQCGSGIYCDSVTSTTGVLNIVGAADWKIYPNPATAHLVVENAAGATLSIFNAVGQLIRTQELKSDRETVNIADLTNGMYLMQLANGLDKRLSQKIIKE